MARSDLLRVTALGLFLVVLPARGEAAEPLPSGARLAATDALLQASLDQPVVLTFSDGRELAAVLLAVNPGELVIALCANSEVRVEPLANVRTLQPLTTCSRPPPAPQPVRSRPRQRHLALGVSLAPGLFTNLDVGLFHAFFNFDVLLPGLTRSLYPLSFGMGVGIPVLPGTQRLKFDIFAHVNLLIDRNSNGAFFGVGIGLHHTWQNGATLGFALPLGGYGVSNGRAFYSTTDAIVSYYLSGVYGMPILYAGYRI